MGRGAQLRFPEAEFLDEIQKKEFSSLLLTIHSHLYRNRIHNRTILFRFLGIILKVLRLEVSYGFITPFREGGMVYCQVFLLFTVYSD